MIIYIKKMKISFITPVYNEEIYLSKLFKNIEKNYYNYDFEWIFIDDWSTDKSYELISSFLEDKDKIKLIKNEGRGKIDAINYGFKLAKGEYIKLVGGDDEIDLRIIDLIKEEENNKISYVHNAKIIDTSNKKLGNYIPPYQLFNYSKDDYFLENISCPSWCWIFPRKEAEKFFPIPRCEYEDLYLSFCIKKFTKIQYLNDYFYFYRQNPGQTFGNVLLFNNEIGQFRSKRSLKSLSIIKNCKIFNIREKYLLSKSRQYYIFYIKKKNILQILLSQLPSQRKMKLIIFRYLFPIYGYIQKIKYSLDQVYHEYINKNHIKKDISVDNQVPVAHDIEIKNKKLIIFKSCLSYPTPDGLTNQFYGFLSYFNLNNKCKSFLFCKDNFDEQKFMKKFKNIKEPHFINTFPQSFAPFTIRLIYLVTLYKLGLKKIKLFDDLENFSKNLDYNFYFHDIVFYPLLFLKINKKKIIFSITDFQSNRLLKLIFTSSNLLKSLYYFIGFIHCIFIESFMFKKIKYLHIYSRVDEKLLEKFFSYKNLISIPNFNLVKRKKKELSKENPFQVNSQKILIMGDLNQVEHFKGILKLSKLKYFKKFQNKFIFVVRGSYKDEIKNKINQIFTNCEFENSWFNEDDYLLYLDSFKILLFLDSIEFGLSNRVADALKANSLIVGFKSAFTGYYLKNFEQAIFINNFFDFVYAYNLKRIDKNEIIENAKITSVTYNLNTVKSKWNNIT